MTGGLAGGELGIGRPGRFHVSPLVAPPLDPAFRPAVLSRPALEAAALASGGSIVRLAVEQPNGSVYGRDTAVFADEHPDARSSHESCERLIKFLIWSCGGNRVWVDGPPSLVAFLRHHYESDPTGMFDARLLGGEIYGAPFEILATPAAEFPVARERSVLLGRHLDGCRIGFDLGASDRKAAAVIDGEVVFSEEIAWDPANHRDPSWHFDQINDSLKRAAAHLPRVDAIGGSAAGVYVDSEVRVASLFRSVPRDLFEGRVRGLFGELQRAWRGIPFVVVNDGEVTALAGAMLTGVGGLLGVAMGSSEAAGYVGPDGGLTLRLNELAFAPIDVALAAPVDEWSGDRGCGVQYLSQQAAARLLGPAGIEADPAMTLPERLVLLQDLMAREDVRAAAIYETIGTYLGYALLEYREFYEFEHVLLLGRVLTGAGGELLASRAREAIRAEDPVAGGSITFHAVPEREKRHGQAVAAASLPAIGT